jgi:hypothetical protein
MTNLTRFHYIFALLITPTGCETRLKNLPEMSKSSQNLTWHIISSIILIMKLYNTVNVLTTDDRQAYQYHITSSVHFSVLVNPHVGSQNTELLTQMDSIHVIQRAWILRKNILKLSGKSYM